MECNFLTQSTTQLNDLLKKATVFWKRLNYPYTTEKCSFSYSTTRFLTYRGNGKPVLMFSTHTHNWDPEIELWTEFSAVVLTFFPCSLRSSLQHSEIKSFLHCLRESTFVCLPANSYLTWTQTHTETHTYSSSLFFSLSLIILGEVLCFTLTELCLSLHCMQLTTQHKSKWRGE